MKKGKVKVPKKVYNEDLAENNDFSFIYVLPLIGGGAALVPSETENSTITVPEITFAVAAPVAPQPAISPVSNNILLGASLTANSPRSFNWDPNDPSIPAWQKDVVGTDYILKNIKDSGMNTVSFNFRYSLDPKTDTFFRPEFRTAEFFRNTPDWDTIEAGAVRAVAVGLKPVFYMAINMLPISEKALVSLNYVPSNPDSFFASYKELLVKIATLSEKYDSPYMSIGVELGPVVTDPKYLEYWEDIISTVKSIYDGKLSYSSFVNDKWDFNTELTEVTFADKLDMFGFNVYPETLDHGELDGTYEEFYQEWKTDIVPGLQSLAEKLDKPVFISEFGLSRIDGGGAKRLYGTDVGMTLDLNEQADLFDAALKAIYEGFDTEGIILWGAADDIKWLNGTADPMNSYTGNWIDVPAELTITKWMNEFTTSYSFG